MTAVVVGIDPSPARIGLCAVARLPLERLELAISGGTTLLARLSRTSPARQWQEWQHETVRALIERFARDLAVGGYDVVAWYREQPMSPRSRGMTRRFGYVCAAVDAAAVQRWPAAETFQSDIPGENGINPGEWRTATGLRGNASKDEVRRHAEKISCGEFATQDEADAYLVAIAGQIYQERGIADAASPE